MEAGEAVSVSPGGKRKRKKTALRAVVAGESGFPDTLAAPAPKKRPGAGPRGGIGAPRPVYAFAFFT